jgi:formate--tetrahydrofolate ligase
MSEGSAERKTMKTDIEIADATKLQPITEIAAKLGLSADDIEQYGHAKAKIMLPLRPEVLKKAKDKKHRLVLVTAMSPTPAGEGKTTVLIGLADALNLLGHQATIAMREPSQGSVFGIKGGATGGGYSQVAPMEDINLHFTGDMHALSSANNTLAALIDNAVMRGNAHGLDPRRIIWKRVEDVNDRALRSIVTGLGGIMDGIPRQTGFDITAASELMAILCLSTSLADLKKRIGRIVVGYTSTKEPVTVSDLGYTDAIALLLKDAIKPNLVQSLEGTPALIHGGPFANIAHGCNSVLATRTAMQLSDYTVTEAGFGADLGAEKFLDITSRQLGAVPDAVVMVATVRSLKYNGGVPVSELTKENLDALKAGLPNVVRHIRNIQRYGLPVCVALNHFASDTDAEIELVRSECEKLGVQTIVADEWAQGGKGAEDVAREVVRLCEQGTHFHPLYDLSASLEEKINTIATTIYGAKSVIYSAHAKKQLAQFAAAGWDHLPVCIAKTQYSFTDDQHQLGAPTGFDFHIRELEPKIGAGFIVALAGSMMTMPGLPTHPAAEQMTISDQGVIRGLF